jgi:ATPase family associated with various cellular activities (AAA)
VTIATSGSSVASAFKAARKVSVPLVVIRTNDPAATVETLGAALPDATKPLGVEKPLILWDAVNGMRPVNATGQAALYAMLGIKAGENPQTLQMKLAATIPFVETCAALAKVPPTACVVAYNAHLQWNDTAAKQAIWNLRDLLTSKPAMLVLLTTLGAPVPAELANDVITLTEPLPTPDDLAAVVHATYVAVNQQADETSVAKAVDALVGARSVFVAGQISAMSMTGKGMDIDALLAQKKALINDTPGLRWIDPQFTYDALGGLDALKKFFTRVFTGKAAPTAIVFVDEIDDMLAGVGTDTSGVSTILHGKILTHMVRTKALGALLLGHPGVGKSAICEATAAEFGVPFINFDLGDMKNSLVGSSEERATTALAVIDAVSRGSALFVGTANSTGNLSPQLQSRFPFRFFFDLPTAAEKQAIWPIYEQHPHPAATAPLTAAQLKDRPVDTDWTGREIAKCAEYAYMFGCTLKEAADYVVPIAMSMPEQIDKRRQEAANRYLSASYPGTYRVKGEDTPTLKTEPVLVVGKFARKLSDMKES